MNYKEIEDAVADILLNESGDGHIDGSDTIARFIEALMNGKGEQWINKYRSK